MVSAAVRRGGRWFSPAGFVLVGLFFLLPFVAVGCVPGGYGRVTAGGATTYTGVTLVTGGRPAVTADKLRPAAEQTDDRLGVQPLAVAVLLVLVVGLVLAVAVHDPRVRRAAVTVSGAISLVFLVANQATVQSLLVEKVRAQLTQPIPADHKISDYVQARNGFWLSALVLLILTIANAVGWRRARRRAGPGRTLFDRYPLPARDPTDRTLPNAVDPWPTEGGG